MTGNGGAPEKGGSAWGQAVAAVVLMGAAQSEPPTLPGWQAAA
ncbi:hypothetical protein [Streptomyces sp. CA2R106]